MLCSKLHCQLFLNRNSFHTRSFPCSTLPPGCSRIDKVRVPTWCVSPDIPARALPSSWDPQMYRERSSLDFPTRALPLPSLVSWSAPSCPHTSAPEHLRSHKWQAEVAYNNYFAEMCSDSEAGLYLRLIDLMYHSTLGVRVIKKKKKML